MKPIHHSKLKKGDLIYVESYWFTSPELAEFLGSCKNIYGISFNGDDVVYLSTGTKIYLIERGYFL